MGEAISFVGPASAGERDEVVLVIFSVQQSCQFKIPRSFFEGGVQVSCEDED